MTRSDAPTVSVLDLIPVRRGQSTGEALAASVHLARVAEAAGVHRYWVAEHHNMPAVASTNPPVLIAMLAGATERMRIGSGGVMLPNHAPLVVAEQFALLEAAHPGRIDLGIGRAPGTDNVTSWALRGGTGEGAVANFDRYVAEIIALMDPAGAQVDLASGPYSLNATPAARTTPTMWLLGSSDYSARLAARMGLPYVFATHFATGGTAEALRTYREEFVPSEHLDAPHTFLTVNASVAATDEEAQRRARPQLLGMLALRTGQPLRPQMTVEECERTERERGPLPRQHEALIEAMQRQWVIGAEADAAAKIRDLVGRYGVDEVMVNPVAAAADADPSDRSPAREETITRLVTALAI